MPLVTTCGFPSWTTTRGVAQVVGSSRRSLRHCSLPLFASRATMKSLPSWSQFTTRVFPKSAGEAPSPKPRRVVIVPRSRCQRTLPWRSRA
ncbi:MAG: hypothetical protein DMF79_02165 [Acidobacteria bacterium]|nr:MAG: hypothetical protein DMF79_02165 [Acidobacteriota bacterium]